MSKFFQFGEDVKGYNFKVLNEREVRAGAGILFLFSMIVSMTVFLVGNYFPLKLFVIAFLIDFIIRVLINPKFSPSLIIGRFFVRNQEVEYVSAPPKRFAWIIGLLLVSFMFVFLVLLNLVSPINFFVCIICLIFLFSESVLGVCLGCMVYPLFNKQKAMLCAGGVCKPKIKQKIQRISISQLLIVILFLALLILIPIVGILTHISPNAVTTVSSPTTTTTCTTVNTLTNVFKNKVNSDKTNTVVNDSAGVRINTTNQSYFTTTPDSSTDCEVPQWAIAIGHEKLYKLHHGCN